MNSIEYNGYTYQTPSCFDELTKEQYLRICIYLMQRNLVLENDSVSEDYRTWFLRKWKEEILVVLLDEERPYFGWSTRMENLRKMDSKQQTQLVNHREIMGLFEGPPTFSNYLLPEFKYKGVTYYGPPRDLMTISIAEWIEAYIFYANYSLDPEKKENEDLLTRLISTLYRPKKSFRIDKRQYGVDFRQEASPVRKIKLVEKFKGLPEYIKMAVLIQFSNHLNDFMQSFPESFPDGGETPDEVNPRGFMQLLFYVAQEGLFGSLKDTEQVGAFSFFLKVEGDAEKQRVLRKEMEKFKSNNNGISV